MILPPLRRRLAASRIAVEHTFEIDGDCAVKQCIVSVLECRQRHDASVVDQDINAAKGGLGMHE